MPKFPLRDSGRQNQFPEQKTVGQRKVKNTSRSTDQIFILLYL